MCVSQIGRARRLRSRRGLQSIRHAAVPARMPHGHNIESARPLGTAWGRSRFRGATTTPETDSGPAERETDSRRDLLGHARRSASTDSVVWARVGRQGGVGLRGQSTDNQRPRKRFRAPFRLALRLSAARPSPATGYTQGVGSCQTGSFAVDGLNGRDARGGTRCHERTERPFARRCSHPTAPWTTWTGRQDSIAPPLG